MKKIPAQSRENLIRDIEVQISGGELAPGSRLPSLRELSEEFDLTISGVRRSLEVLCERGLLEFRHGSGIYVRQETPAAESGSARRITIFISGDNPGKDYCAHALAGIRKAAAELDGAIEFDTVPCILQNLSAEPLGGKTPDALILLGCYDLTTRELPGNCPGVGLEMHESYGGRLSTVALDPLDAAQNATGYFLSRGIDRVIVFSSEMPAYAFRADMFANTFRRAGGSCSQIPYHQADLDCLKDPEAGYLFVGDSIAQLLAEKYRAATGRALCTERVILGMDGKRRLFPHYEPFSSIAIDWQYAGRVVLEECLRRITRPGSPAQRLYLNATLDEI